MYIIKIINDDFITPKIPPNILSHLSNLILFKNFSLIFTTNVKVKYNIKKVIIYIFKLSLEFFILIFNIFPTIG